MKNLTTIIFVFFLLFLILSLFVAEGIISFLAIFLGFIIALISLSGYFGRLRGLIIAIVFIILPFLLENILYRLNIPFFDTTIIKSLSLGSLNLPVNVDNLFIVFTLPLLFMTGIIFAQKIKVSFSIKAYHKTILAIIASILIALNFISWTTADGFIYVDFIKWLIIALIINLVLTITYAFKIEANEFYKEIPIIIYLTIFGARALITFDSLQLLIVAVLILWYLYLLYKEYKIKKINLGD